MTDVERLLRTAYLFAWAFSPDPVTKNAAIVVRDLAESARVHGVNRPRGEVATDPKGPIGSRSWTHAEVAALEQARHLRMPTRGAVMVCPWACCQGCAEAIVGAGIGVLIVHAAAIERTPDRWRAEVAAGHGLLKAAGVELVLHEGTLGDCTGYLDGTRWAP